MTLICIVYLWNFALYSYWIQHAVIIFQILNATLAFQRYRQCQTY